MKVYIELRGGLANQLFMLIAGLQIKKVSKAEVVYDCRWVEGLGQRGIRAPVPRDAQLRTSSIVLRSRATAVRVIGTRATLAVSSLARMKPPQPNAIVVESTKSLFEMLEENHEALWLRGYLQNPDVKSWSEMGLLDQLRAFLWPEPDLLDSPEYSLIHVRRGDYVSTPRNSARLGICTLAYFSEAIKLLPTALPIYVVSDDILWCRENLGSLSNRIEILEGGSELADLKLISGAKSLILSNSTYSWWGAVLSAADMVVAPYPWFDDPSSDGQNLSLPNWKRLNKVSGKTID